MKPDLSRQNGRITDRHEKIVLAIALVLPSVVTWVYFYQAESASPLVQWLVFPIVKAFQFGLPIVWVAVVLRERVTLRPRSAAGIGTGLAFGAVVALAIFGLYFGALRGSALLEEASVPIRNKIAGFKIDSVVEYAALGLFYSICHSFLEEYYWRWFVLGRLQRHVPVAAAIMISSVGFMAHHVLVLSKFFGPAGWATWFFSVSVAVGGAVWAWIYHRSNSLVGPWLSHLLVDAAIFSVGFDLARQLLTS